MSVSGSRDHIGKGILWMIITGFFFVSLDATAKFLIQSYPSPQVTWARFFFHSLILIVWFNRRLPRVARSTRPRVQLWRSFLMLLTNGSFFIGVASMPLATASTILFLSPIFITIFAIPILGEKVGPRRWLGVLIGFIGSLIVVRPDDSGISFGVFFLLLAALGNALYQIATRQIRGHDSDATSVFYTGILGAIVMSCVVPFIWVQPVIAWHWLAFAGLGVLGITGHLCLVRAFASAEASVVAPFAYSNLIWATGYGFILFQELPDHYTLLGAALIVASGLYIFYRERQLEAQG